MERWPVTSRFNWAYRQDVNDVSSRSNDALPQPAWVCCRHFVEGPLCRHLWTRFPCFSSGKMIIWYRVCVYLSLSDVWNTWRNSRNFIWTSRRLWAFELCWFLIFCVITDFTLVRKCEVTATTDVWSPMCLKMVGASFQGFVACVTFGEWSYSLRAGKVNRMGRVLMT